MKVVLFANTDWYLFNFRAGLARSIREAGGEPVLISPEAGYGERLRQAGFRWVAVPLSRRSLNPLRELLLIVWLWRFLRRERPDVVHGFTIKAAVYGAIAARLAGARAIVGSIAGLGYVFTSTSLRATLLRPIVQRLIRWSLGGGRARVIVQNPDDLALISRHGLLARDRVAMIRGSGVDTDKFRPGDARRGSVRRVVLPARLLWDKGIAEFVEAARLLRPRFGDVRFQLAGGTDPGNPAAIPQHQIDQWVGAGIVEWLGHVDDMPELLSKADIVVLPSYREGLPKSLLEAAACGIPLVTTDVPGCREVVCDGQDGLLVPPGDAEALAAAIERLLSDPELGRRLGLAARDKVVREFSEARVTRETWSLYRELIGHAAERADA